LFFLYFSLSLFVLFCIIFRVPWYDLHNKYYNNNNYHILQNVSNNNNCQDNKERSSTHDIEQNAGTEDNEQQNHRVLSLRRGRKPHRRRGRHRHVGRTQHGDIQLAQQRSAAVHCQAPTAASSVAGPHRAAGRPRTRPDGFIRTSGSSPCLVRIDGE